MRTFRKNKNKNHKYRRTRKRKNSVLNGNVIQEKNGWKIVYLHGNAYDRGYAHGSLLYREIKKAMRNFEFFLEETFHTTLSEFVKTTVVKIKPAVIRHYPEITQELNGICNGYNSYNTTTKHKDKHKDKDKPKTLTFDKLLAWNSIMSLYDDFYRRANRIAQQEPGIKQRCAAFIATGDATTHGNIVMGHSTYCDFVTGYSQNIVLYIAPPPDQGFPFVMLSEAHCLSDNIASFCRRKSVQPVTVERTSQLTTLQELVTLNHGVSIVPEMARKTDTSDRRVYRSFSGEKPVRTVAMMWNPDRFQSQAVKALMQHLRLLGTTQELG
jgi:hypothetical protein